MIEIIYKRCGRCGKRIPSGTTCTCYDKYKQKRIYAKPEGIKTEYHTQRWKDMREYILSKYNRIDIYTLYRYNRIIPADVIHHMELTRDRPDLFYLESNLIPLSRQAHDEIHERYKREGAAGVVKELKTYKQRYESTGGI